MSLVALPKTMDLFRGMIIAMLLVASFLAIENFQHYLILNFDLVIVLLFAPFIIYVKHDQQTSIRFGILSLCLFILYPFVKLETAFFLGFVFLILFVIEQVLGKLNPSAIYLAVFSSPIVSYFFTVFGFPIRLKLSEISANLLAVLGVDITNEGNNILINGQYLEVEPACMGLKMMVVGVVICLAIITFVEQKEKRYFSLIQIGLIILTTIALLIGSNLGRLILLIFFQIGQDGFSHQALGILSLIFYCLLPMYLLIPVLNKRFASAKLDTVNKSSIPKPIPLIIMLSILSLILMHKLNFKNFIAYKQEVTTLLVELAGFKSELVGFGATKLLSDDALIYVKPCKNFWGLEHTPMICWQGSGYKLRKEKITQIAGQDIYTAALSKGEHTLHTAWWYTNKATQTISQFHWRSEMAKGASAFNLVNVSAETMEELENQVKKVLGEL